MHSLCRSTRTSKMSSVGSFGSPSMPLGVGGAMSTPATRSARSTVCAELLSEVSVAWKRAACAPGLTQSRRTARPGVSCLVATHHPRGMSITSPDFKTHACGFAPRACGNAAKSGAQGSKELWPGRRSLPYTAFVSPGA